MQRLLLALALALVLAACPGNSSPAVDAASDGPARGTFGATCTTLTDTSSECMGKPCTNAFNMFPTPVCSQLCTFGMDSTCPNGSMGPKCNMKGYCRP